MQRRRKLILTYVLLGTLGVFVGLRLSLNRIVWSRIAGAIHDTYGIVVAVDKLSISLLDGRATARGLRVTDGEALVLGAEEVQLAASIRDILGGSYEFETLVVTSFTALDRETTCMKMGVLAKRGADDDPAFQAELEGYMKEHAAVATQDFAIWENKRYEPKPMLCDADGPIGEHRRWATQFYADGAAR